MPNNILLFHTFDKSAIPFWYGPIGQDTLCNKP